MIAVFVVGSALLVGGIALIVLASTKAGSASPEGFFALGMIMAIIGFAIASEAWIELWKAHRVRALASRGRA